MPLKVCVYFRLPLPMVKGSVVMVDSAESILSSSSLFNASPFFLLHLAEHLLYIYIKRSGTGVIIATATGTTTNRKQFTAHKVLKFLSVFVKFHPEKGLNENILP